MRITRLKGQFLIMKFSVIIPVYNKASSILRTLESVYNQTYRDLEIIVVDDGSTDNLNEILNDWMDRLVLIRQKNAGVSAARNAGIAASTGVYICFLDADDTWMPDHLEVLNQALQSYPEACFLSTMYVSTFADGSSRSKSHLLKKFGYYTWVADYFKLVLDTSSTIIHTDTVCIDREILKTMQFVPGERIGEDTDLWYRVAAYYPLLLIKKETAVYHREDSTATIEGNNNLDWAFARRESTLIQDSLIPKRKRKNIQLLLDRWRCTCCRELLRKWKIKEARSYLKQVKYPLQIRVVYCWLLCAKACFAKRIMK